MKIFLEKEKKVVEREFSGQALSLLALLGVNPETVLIVKNNCVVTEQEELADSDDIRLLSVVSGG
ncbi:MAG: MoaD/ThiS family protein [Nanoarchaeota archaeon]